MPRFLEMCAPWEEMPGLPVAAEAGRFAAEAMRGNPEAVRKNLHGLGKNLHGV